MLPTLCRKPRRSHTCRVPRISAATVAEHRATQRRALLRAAAGLVESGGVAAVTPTAVAERAGMARTSVYDYFDTREDLLVAVALDAFEGWSRDLAASLDGVPAGLPRLRRYIEATMEMAADGRHGLATTLRFADLGAHRAEEVAALHDALQEPLPAILADAGVDDPAGVTPYVQALISTAMARVSRGEDARRAAHRVHDLLVNGLPLPPTGA